MLEDVYKTYRELADEIEWKKFDQNDLFFNYLKYKDGNNVLAEKFYAALMCRYWGYTGRLYSKCNKNVPFEECYDVLVDTINYLLDKQVWNNPESSLYKDPKGPEKAFHFVLKRQLSILLSRKTTDKRKGEFKALSIDDIHEKYDDAADGLFELVPTTSESSFELYEYINSRSNLFEKIVLDLICFSDWASLQSIVIKLKKLGDGDFMEYRDKYNITESEYKDFENKIRSLTNKDLLIEIKKLLYLMRDDWK